MQSKSILALLIAFLCLAGSMRPSIAEAALLTQRDWMINLVEALGLSYGLPDSPQDADYLRLLGGNRTLRIEAEDSHHPEDMISASDIGTFGTFSGGGWVSGLNVPATMRLNVLLPRAGTYRLSASLRLPGHRLTLAGKTILANGGSNFTRVDLGEVELKAGQLTIQVVLPPNGGLDYLELHAPSLPTVEPAGGWNLDRPLDLDVMAETAARLLGLEVLLPVAGDPVRIEAEGVLAAGDADIVKSTHLGEPSGGKWVRTGGRATAIELSLAQANAGVYEISVRGAGEGSFSARINGGPEVLGNFPPYLGTVSLGTHPLAAGKNRIRVELPPRAGIDVVLLQRRRAAGSDYRRLTGLPPEGSAPTTDQVNAFLSLLSVLGEAR